MNSALPKPLVWIIHCIDMHQYFIEYLLHPLSCSPANWCLTSDPSHRWSCLPWCVQVSVWSCLHSYSGACEAAWRSLIYFLSVDWLYKAWQKADMAMPGLPEAALLWSHSEELMFSRHCFAHSMKTFQCKISNSHAERELWSPTSCL
jgi:hypothetical protein